ncbi:MAG: IS1595 family transposase, partial [Leeuwenhoekiella sp.]
LKAGLRSVYSWVHENHIEKYLDEYSYRLNRSIHKQTIFDNLIDRMAKTKPIDYKDIKIST